ncbi:MAG TPA: hypothetical protein ENI34_06610 [candidate division WOR-3 bacterium]|uniref:Uncharacterized protein n=1 Tax=candidate division WOR-3 bacterium TaxID=2052148 RepID=A0A9C9EMF8_UNCW3|nr:hypothetical protein [candidate division WOR-3 bacterium]
MSLFFFLVGVFETQLFPGNIFFEEQFNPALINKEEFTLAVRMESHFSLPAVRTYSLYSTLKSYSINCISFGNELYKENTVKTGIIFPFNGRLKFGFNLGLLNYWIKENCNRFSYTVGLGVRYNYASFQCDGWVNNINFPRFSDYDYLPLTYSVRTSYSGEKNYSFNFAVRGQGSELPFFNLGFSYCFYRLATLGVGVNTAPVYLEYLFSFSPGKLIVGYAGRNHQDLGLSHSFSIGFNL